jgi:hypothetical protein
MPRRIDGNRVEQPSERGALVIGRIYPNARFAWIIKTGAAIDRAALATVLEQDHPTPTLTDLAGRLRQMASPAADRACGPDYLTIKKVNKFLKVTARALRGAECVEGNDCPKGIQRIETEAALISVMLRWAADRIPMQNTEAR